MTPAYRLGPGDGALPGQVDVVAQWVRSYLCRPHPRLGRPGPVCPYVRKALECGSLLVSVSPPGIVGTDQAIPLMRGYRDWFTVRGALDPPDPHRALLVVFPVQEDDRVHRTIEEAQRRLKTEFVERGLMIGEFHDGPPPVPGLWNPDFRPLHSPVPLLAIRPMVANDLAFLRSDHQHLEAYHARFG